MTLKKLFFILILFSGVAAIGQERMVRGTVTSPDGTPLPGVNVLIEGTTTGVITDLQGAFEIAAPSNAALVFSYIGYATHTEQIDDRQEVHVVMREEHLDLKELVVIGYGTKKKADLSSAISVVDADDLKKTGAASFDNAIQGKAAGVVVSQTSGMPGSTPTVKIRGIGSINRGSEPLYIIDGVPTGNLFSFNPADIESIQILKDASASAIYGAQASNGVILVTTKKGVQGKTKTTFSAERGISYFNNKLDMMDGGEYSDFMINAYDDARELFGVDQVLPIAYTDSMRAVNNYISTDWQDELTQLGTRENYHLGISGGSEKLRFSGSGGYYKEEGTLVSTGIERFTLRSAVDVDITDRIRLGNSVMFSRINSDESSTWVWGSMNSSPLMPVYKEDNLGGFGGPDPLFTGRNERTNPVAEAMLRDNNLVQTKMLTTSYVEVDLLTNLRYKFQLGLDYNLSHNRQWLPMYELGGGRSNNNASLTEINGESRSWITDHILTYDNLFGEHHLTALVGYSARYSISNSISVVGSDFPEPTLNVMSQAQQLTSASGEIWEHRLLSQFSRIMYDFKGKYLFTASLRRDGSSNFGPNSKWGLFPAFSAGWKLNEDLLQQVDQINMMKLRFGWGATGNQDIPAFSYTALLNPPSDFRYVFGENQDTYFGQGLFESFGNKDIRWESAKMTNIGVDIYAFNQKLQFTAEYYIKNQDGMLVQITLPGIYGLGQEDIDIDIHSANPWVNLGEIQNKGWDLTLNYRNMESRLKYAVNTSFTTVKNTVKYLPYDSYITGEHITTVGKPIGAFYGYIAEGIFQSPEDVANHASQEQGTAPGDIKFKDTNNDGEINNLDMTVIGKHLPDYTFGVGIELYYGSFDFSAFLNGMMGMQLYNQLRTTIGVATDKDGLDNNKLAEVMDYWKETNPSTTMTRAHVIDPNDNARFSTWFVEDASFVRLKNVQVGYNLPLNLAERVNIAGMRIYLSGNNLFVLTRYSGYDPEVGSKSPLTAGVDNGNYPIPESFSAGIQIDF